MAEKKSRQETGDQAEVVLEMDFATVLPVTLQEVRPKRIEICTVCLSIKNHKFVTVPCKFNRLRCELANSCFFSVPQQNLSLLIYPITFYLGGNM